MRQPRHSFEPHFLQYFAAGSFSAPQTGQDLLAMFAPDGAADGDGADCAVLFAAAGAAGSLAPVLAVGAGGAVGVAASAPVRRVARNRSIFGSDLRIASSTARLMIFSRSALFTASSAPAATEEVSCTMSIP